MNFKRSWPWALLVLAPVWMGLNKEKWKKVTTDEEKKVLIGRTCDNPEDRDRIEKNSNAVKNRARSLSIAVDEPTTGACGYELVSGQKMHRIPAEATEEQVLTELNAFFPKKK